VLKRWRLPGAVSCDSSKEYGGRKEMEI
jgi:hypothetical protein